MTLKTYAQEKHHEKSIRGAEKRSRRAGKELRVGLPRRKDIQVAIQTRNLEALE